MNLPGNNELRLCGAAVCELLQKYLEDSVNYKAKSPLVKRVTYSGPNSEYIFTLETRPTEEAKK